MSDNFKSVKEFSNLVSLSEKGQSLVGVYLKSYEYKAKDEKTYTVHVFDRVKEDGGREEVQMFGSGSLDFLLSKVETGKMVKVVYEGLTTEEVETSFGKKRIHQFDVLVAS